MQKILLVFEDFLYINPHTAALPQYSIVARASARGAGRRGLIPNHVVKIGRFAFLGLALGINELGNQVGGAESV